MAAYARKMFGMYGDKEEWVCIECDNSFAGVMIDRFGKDVSIIRLDDKHFVVNVEVAVIILAVILWKKGMKVKLEKEPDNENASESE